MIPIKFTEAPIFKHSLMSYREGDGFYRSDLSPGDAKWHDLDDGLVQLSFCCPCGCGAVNQIPIYTIDGGYGWKWDGNRDEPTLTPSIQQLTKCKWHGHLTKGKWVP